MTNHLAQEYGPEMAEITEGSVVTTAPVCCWEDMTDYSGDKGRPLWACEICDCDVLTEKDGTVILMTVCGEH
ncbi:hypothetical protein [Embleya sp. NPDC005575]|uniref:hypothetical protein n=1 Tax=Embleya sp. NPDC005575 TaxID=3156892 RepID=UPI0033AAC557